MRLLVFTRYPEPGRVKTRLIPALGAAGAERLHRQMAEHTIKKLGCFACIEVCFDGGGEKEMREWLGGGLSYTPQGKGDLGRRLLFAFSRAFREGEDKVVAVGTDCPALEACHVEKAFGILDRFDLVLGPAEDGGYYLIGMNRLLRELFEDIHWGTGRVFMETIYKAYLSGLKTGLLERLADVDRPEDLKPGIL